VRHEDPVILRPAGGARPFVVERHAPRAALADRVAHVWTVEWHLPAGAAHDQEVLSAPALHLTVEAGAVELHGVVTRRYLRRLQGSGRVLGCRFRAGGLLGAALVPLSSLLDRAVAAQQVLGAWVGELPSDVERAQDLLAACLPPADPRGRLVERAVDLLAAEHELRRVTDLADRLGTTPRTLQRRFEQCLGVGPKEVLQRQRISDALVEVEAGAEVDWAALAAELGFADQPHLTRVFRDLVGVTPAAYERRVRLSRSAPRTAG
jgi:AraC-like DNA-binding protein